MLVVDVIDTSRQMKDVGEERDSLKIKRITARPHYEVHHLVCGLVELMEIKDQRW